MKTKSLFIVIALIFSAVGIQAQTNMFEKFSNNKDVTTVFVSKAMLSMIPDTNVGGADIKNMTDKLDQIEIYTTENKNACSQLRTATKSLLSDKTYEVLMSVKEENENVTFYGFKQQNKFKDLIMFVDQPDECVVIRFVGAFTMEDIQQIMNKDKKKDKKK